MSETKELLKQYRVLKQRLFELGLLKKHESKWNRFISENYPIVKAALIKRAIEQGEVVPNARQLFTMVNKFLSAQYRSESGVIEQPKKKGARRPVTRKVRDFKSRQSELDLPEL